MHRPTSVLGRLTTRNPPFGSPFPLALDFVPHRRAPSTGECGPADTSNSGFARSDHSFGASRSRSGRNRNAPGAAHLPAHSPSSERPLDEHDCSLDNSPTSARRSVRRTHAVVAGRPYGLALHGKRLVARCLFVSRDAAIRPQSHVRFALLEWRWA